MSGTDWDWASVPMERTGLNRLADMVEDDMARKGFTVSWEEMPEKLLLIHAEASEAVEVLRATEEPTEAFTEEIVDILVRTLHIACFLNAHGHNVEGAFVTKMGRNRGRARMHRRRF